MPFSSALLENAVDEFANLPATGRTTALRLVLHFSEVVSRMGPEIMFCQR